MCSGIPKFIFVVEDKNVIRNFMGFKMYIDPLNAELNPICHLLALLGGATIVVVSRLRVKSCINTILYNNIYNSN